MQSSTRLLPRADTVGSLLRPAPLLMARAAFAEGKIDEAALRVAENRAIDGVIKFQEDIGLPIVTDGEFRRENWWVDFVQGIDGVVIEDGTSTKFSHEHGKPSDYIPKTVKTEARLNVSGSLTARDYRYVADRTDAVAKVTLPSPTRMHFHGGRNIVARSAYPDIEEFYADLANIYRQEIARLEVEGCRYIQIDDPLLTYFLDSQLRLQVQSEGEDPDERLRRYVKLINDSIAARGPETLVGIHLCRGNARGNWIAEGDYEGLAEECFGNLNVDRFLLEYDDERSGDFKPLRFVPAGRQVVLGLVSTRSASLEVKDEVKRRIEKAGEFFDLSYGAISPQCGFASVVEGNAITLAVQEAKLRLVTDLAIEFWGHAI